MIPLAACLSPIYLPTIQPQLALPSLSWWTSLKFCRRQPLNQKGINLGISPPNFSMIIGSWNMRGLGSPLKHRYILNLLSAHKVSIATILETKLNDVSLASLMKKKFSNWNHCHNLDLASPARILVLWKADRLDLEILHITVQAIHYKFTCKITSSSFIITFVYGLHSITSRRPLWDFICSMESDISLPWILVGDFNSIRSPSNKINGSEVIGYEISDFNSCCLTSDLSDLTLLGAFFSWSNGSVFSQIVRAIVNPASHQSFPQSFAHVSDIGRLSDHGEIIISVRSDLSPRVKGFKFSNELTLSADFLPLIHHHWSSSQVYGTKAYTLCRKLKSLKGPLKKLHHNACGSLASRIQEADKIYAALSANQHPSFHSSLTDLWSLAINLRAMEHAQLSHRAKFTFLMEADKSTSYFHSVISKKRQNIFIPTLLNADGSITRSEVEMASKFIGHFSNILGNSEAIIPPVTP